MTPRDGSYGAGGTQGFKALDTYVPLEFALEFAPGEAYQFDRSHEQLEIGGMPMA